MNVIHPRTVRRPSRLRPLRGLVLLLAWLFATGTHWDLVQVAGWARMWYRSAQTESVVVALDSTFAPGATCELCAVADEGRAAHGPASDALLRPLGRPVLVTWDEEPVRDLKRDSEEYERVWSARLGGLTRASPPTPPPRGRQV